MLRLEIYEPPSTLSPPSARDVLRLSLLFAIPLLTQTNKQTNKLVQLFAIPLLTQTSKQTKKQKTKNKKQKQKQKPKKKKKKPKQIMTKHNKKT